MLDRKHVTGSLHISPQGIYYIKYRITDPIKGPSKSKSKSTGLRARDNTKRRAEQFMKDFLAEVEKRENQEPLVELENPPFSTYVDRWLENRKGKIEPNSLKSYHDYNRCHILPMLGDIPVRDLEYRTLQDFCDRLLENHSVSSVRKILVVINGGLAEAVREGVLLNDLTKYIELPRERRKEKKAYSPEQLATLLTGSRQAGEPIRAAVLLASCYGLRREEALGLRWTDIDFDAGTLTVRNTVTQNGTMRLERERTKTTKSNRVLSLLPLTIPYLKKLMETQKQAGLTLDKVCIWPDGKEVRPDYITRRTKTLMRDCGLPVLTYHQLRHTASTLLAGHVTVKQLQTFLGHEDAGTTMNIYTHIRDYPNNCVNLLSGVK